MVLVGADMMFYGQHTVAVEGSIRQVEEPQECRNIWGCYPSCMATQVACDSAAGMTVALLAAEDGAAGVITEVDEAQEIQYGAQ